MNTKRLLILSLAINGLLAVTALIAFRLSGGAPAPSPGQPASGASAASVETANNAPLEPPPAVNVPATAALASAPAHSAGTAWTPAQPPAAITPARRMQFSNPSTPGPSASIAPGGGAVLATSSAVRPQSGGVPNAAGAPGVASARVAPSGPGGAAQAAPSAASPSAPGSVAEPSAPAAQDATGSVAPASAGAPQSEPPAATESTGADRSPPRASETEITVPDGGVKVPAVLEDPSALNLNEQQQDQLKTLQDEFLAALSRGSHDPTDPAYQKLWEVAQTMSDERFKALFGHEAYLIQQIQANLQRASDRNL
jgi:hypothetical protein